jgi:hypothetical protein
MTELELGKYEFYPYEDELKKKDLIDPVFEKKDSDLDNKSIDELIKEIRILRARRRKQDE